ncbi:MAG TPA: asparagine synthase (glutamine-hydrolyzing) [Thermoanaerobaculia bacterium]|jgi:asparagine synthase (glutamine-hydrolysing)|nr:asparagine synthase (glutamine-hydrolyzing) [Thermoanaerobaculia bacterium]
MCGIAGYLTFDGTPVDQGVVAAMARSLAHRGPDGESVTLFPQLGLAHRRLTIIDLATGDQPMANEDGQVQVIFNGEIYNFRELRSDLERAGHRFHSQSDTEVIVHAWEQWGAACVEHLRGMFAFALVDWRRQLLFLARDPLGIKPLYYLSTPRRFAFASELRALRCLPGAAFDIDLAAIDQYLFLKYIPAPRTAYQQVLKLPPGHRLTVPFSGETGPPQQYWRLALQPQSGRSADDWVEELDSVVRESVRAHLVADVPVGAFLSGGIDSSLVVGTMAELVDRPVATFTIGFEESDYDESGPAAFVAGQVGSEHHREVVRPQAMAILPELVDHYGEPFGDSSALPTFYVSRLAQQHVKVALSGDGGDELFSGYDSHRRWLRWLGFADVARPAWFWPLRRLAGALLPGLHPPRRRDLTGWLRMVTVMRPQMRRALWRPEHRWASEEPLEIFEREFARGRTGSAVDLARHMDITTYLPFDILTKVDVASMIHSLEVRTPLADVRVAEFAARVPEELLIARRDGDELEGKVLVKRALARRYPRSFVDRPKRGFAVPVRRWLSSNGALLPEVEARLLGPKSALLEYFEPTVLRQLLVREIDTPLWLLLFLEEWLRQNRCAPTH